MSNKEFTNATDVNRYSNPRSYHKPRTSGRKPSSKLKINEDYKSNKIRRK